MDDLQLLFLQINSLLALNRKTTVELINESNDFFFLLFNSVALNAVLDELFIEFVHEVLLLVHEDFLNVENLVDPCLKLYSHSGFFLNALLHFMVLLEQIVVLRWKLVDLHFYVVGLDD